MRDISDTYESRSVALRSASTATFHDATRASTASFSVAIVSFPSQDSLILASFWNARIALSVFGP